jgi:hypothetical protein
VVGNFGSPTLAGDPELVNIGEVSGTGPTDGWPVGPSTVALKFRAEVPW